MSFVAGEITLVQYVHIIFSGYMTLKLFAKLN